MRRAISLLATAVCVAGIPHDWTHAGRVAAEHVARFTFALRQRNLDKLEQTFWAVSDPQSDSYGDHLSADDLARLIAPPTEHQQQLLDLLRGMNVTELATTRTQDIVRCHMTIGQAEALFNTTFHAYTHPHPSGKTVTMIRGAATLQPGRHPDCDYTDPLPHIVQFVPEVCEFPVISRATPVYEQPAVPRAKQPEPKARGAALWPPYDWPFHPDQLKVLYNVPDTLVGDGLEEHGQAVATTGSYDPADLAQFLTLYVPTAIGQDIGKSINFTNDPTRGDPEPTVDVEYTIGMGPKVFTFLWGLRGDFVSGEMWMNIALDYFNYPTPPKVFTVSYTTGEEWLMPSRGVSDRMNVEFQKMGAAGGSLLFASTDYGVGCWPPTSRFSPFFPQTSPYITTVGGTKTFYNTTTTTYRGSGGGFSDFFPRPSYQDALVSAYLTTAPVLPPASLYNASGRAFPDIAFEGQNMGTIRGGADRTISGTSASCPALAGLISLLNQVRFNAGLPALGFLNPLLYQLKTSHPAAFTDVTDGSNVYPCGQSGWNCPCQTVWTTSGFYATAGWNPVTGLGMPNFGELSNAILTFPKKFRARQAAQN